MGYWVDLQNWSNIDWPFVRREFANFGQNSKVYKICKRVWWRREATRMTKSHLLDGSEIRLRAHFSFFFFLKKKKFLLSTKKKKIKIEMTFTSKKLKNMKNIFLIFDLFKLFLTLSNFYLIWSHFWFTLTYFLYLLNIFRSKNQPTFKSIQTPFDITNCCTLITRWI